MAFLKKVYRRLEEKIFFLKLLKLRSKLLLSLSLVILVFLLNLHIFQEFTGISDWRKMYYNYWFYKDIKNPDYENHRLKCIDIMRQKYRTVVKKYVKNNRPILIDLVDHWNLGDSFIQMGEMTFLKELGYPPRLECTWHTCNKTQMKREINSNTTPPILLIHGGGNTGDLWRPHAKFKNKILKDFSSLSILALPQTIYYKNKRLAWKDAQDFKRHGKFTILVRDKPSLRIARMVYKIPTTLCPDAAFMIGPIQAKDYICKPKYDVLILSRNDHEAGSAVEQYLPQVMKELERAGFTYLKIDWFDWKHFIGSREIPQNLFDLAKLRLDLGVEMLCQGKIILTNRLHAMILSTLMGKPHVYVDTSFKKIGGFRKTFFSTQPDCSDRFLRGRGAAGWLPALKHIKRFLSTGKLD